MHIPDGMLQGSICSVSAVVSAVGIGLAAWKAFFSKKKPQAFRFAAITALIFAGQMMNFSINGGTSGHLLGGVLAVALLGVPFGILSMAFVVTIQCLAFADGGVSVLGVNILNMAIIGVGIGGLMHTFLINKFPLKSFQYAIGLALAAWASVMMAALACSIELGISGTISFSKVIGAMFGAHALIGIGEGLITVVVCRSLAFKPIKDLNRKSAMVPLAASGIIAFILSPFASGLPDGLEWVAAKYSFLHESAPTFVSPLAGYAIPVVKNEMLTTGLAGLAGVIITFFIAWFAAKLLNNFDQLKINS